MKFFYSKILVITGCLINCLLFGNLHKELLMRRLAAQHPQFKKAAVTTTQKSALDTLKPIQRTESKTKIGIAKD